MLNKKIYQCSSLGEIESILQEKFTTVSLVSEVPIAKTDLMHMQQLLKHTFSKYRTQSYHLVAGLWREYPLTCLTATVYIGVYHYDGNYWGHFSEYTGCQPTHTQAWKECLLEEIQRRKLPVFDEFGQQKYVSTILGHAGVPQKSFPGFMEGFLAPAFEMGLSASEALDEISGDDNNPRLRFYQLHKGVRDYLSTGGKVAEDFVDRCLQVLEDRHLGNHQSDSFLPRRILKLFLNWQQDKQQRPTDGRNNHLIAPSIVLDPYFEGLAITIPTETIKATGVYDAEWTVSVEGRILERISCDVVELRSSKDIQLIPRISQLRIMPDRNYEVKLMLDRNEYRRWHLSSVTPLVVDGKSRAVIKRALIAGDGQWVILKKTFQPDESSLRLFRMHNETMYREWSAYTAWELDSEVNAFITFQDGSDKITIPVTYEQERPYLLQDQSGPSFGGDKPAYYLWPTLCLPGSAYPDFRSRLSHWRMSLTHINTGNKEELELEGSEGFIRFVGDQYHIDLNQFFNHKKVIGVYILRLIGVLGSDIRVEFQIIPETLRIQGLTIPVFPNPQGIYSVQQHDVTISEDYNLTCLGPNAVGFQLTNEQGGMRTYRMSIPEAVTQLTLELYQPQSNTTATLTLLTKAVGWQLHGDTRDRVNTVVHLTENELEHEGPKRVWVHTANIKSLTEHKYIEVSIQLRDPKGKVLQENIRKIRIGQGFTVELMQMYETIRYTDVPSCSVWIRISHMLSQPFRLIEITKQWTISSVLITGEDDLTVSWDESFNTQHRVLRIWHEWQPWVPYQEYAISDGATAVKLSDGLPRGSYLMEWVIKKEDDWFGFLEQVVYPTGGNTHRWVQERGTFPIDNPLAHALLSGSWNAKPLVFNTSHLEQLLQGFNEYGECYRSEQYKNIHHWRHVIAVNKESLIPCFNELLETKPALLGVSHLALMGLHEWPLTVIRQIKLNTVWMQLEEMTPYIYDFGTTRGMMAFLIDKSPDDLYQMSQFIPPAKGLLAQFNVPVFIIQLVQRCKMDTEFNYQIRSLVRNYQESISQLNNTYRQYDELRATLPLLEERKEMLEEPSYLQYPYIVAIVAVGQRFMNRISLPHMQQRLIRELERQVEALTPAWLEHDRYFIESYIVSKEAQTL
jgi:hypothetical protein